MAKSKKKEQKVDETIIDIVETKDNIQDYFNKNSKMIIGLLALLFVLIVGYFIWKYMIIAPKEKAAVEQMYKAQEQFAKDSFALALENPGSGYEGFLEIIDNYSGTNAANSAKYYAGVSYLNLGRFDDAIEYLSGVKSKGDILPIMKLGTLGDAYSESGDIEKAKSFYKKAIAAEDNDFLTPYYLQKLGYLELKLGNKNEATAAFQRIKDDFSKSRFVADIEKFVQ